MLFILPVVVFSTNIKNEIIKTQNKPKPRFSQALRNQRLSGLFFFFRIKYHEPYDKMHSLQECSFCSTLFSIGWRKPKVFWCCPYSIGLGWRKYLLLFFGQNRCFCRKLFKRTGIKSWFFSFLLFIFPLFCTASLIQVTLVYKHILIYNYDEYTVELLLIYTKQMKMKAIYFRGNHIPVCFSF